MAYFTRQELFDLVWTEPTRTIAKKLGRSEVFLARFCRRHNIPLPPRGYWQKLAAGQRVPKPPLPKRHLGQTDELWFGDQSDDLPATPDREAEPALDPKDQTPEAIEERIRKTVGRIALPRGTIESHPLVARLLKDRPEKHLSPFEHRRLNFLSGLFWSLERFGVRVSALATDPSEFKLTIGEHYAALVVQHADEPEGGFGYGARNLLETDPLNVSVWAYTGGNRLGKWEDLGRAMVEKSATEIVVAVLLYGETLRLKAAAREARPHEVFITELRGYIAAAKKADRKERQAMRPFKAARKSNTDTSIGRDRVGPPPAAPRPPIKLIKRPDTDFHLTVQIEDWDCPQGVAVASYKGAEGLIEHNTLTVYGRTEPAKGAKGGVKGGVEIKLDFHPRERGGVGYTSWSNTYHDIGMIGAGLANGSLSGSAIMLSDHLSTVIHQLSSGKYSVVHLGLALGTTWLYEIRSYKFTDPATEKRFWRAHMVGAASDD
jgi:hypothetical protein